MASILLVVLLAIALIQFLRIQRDIERRIAAQRNTPRHQLVPRHYKSFTEVEKALWEIVQQQKRSTVWEDVRFKGREPEFQIVQDYLRRVREDFRRGHRIYGQVIIHSPELKIFAGIERLIGAVHQKTFPVGILLMQQRHNVRTPPATWLIDVPCHLDHDDIPEFP